MSTLTTNMSLIKPAVDGADSGAFGATSMNSNADLIDAHDHTTGKGTPVAAGGLAANSVTTAKILDANVTTAKLEANPGRSIVSDPLVAAATTLAVSGLHGDTTPNLRLYIFLKNATVSDSTIYLRPNNISSGLLVSVQIQTEANALANTTDTTWWVCNLRGSGECIIVADVWCKTGTRRYMNARSTYTKNSDNTVGQFQAAGTVTDTSTEITSFTIVSSVASALDVGSRIEVVRPGFFLG